MSTSQGILDALVIGSGRISVKDTVLQMYDPIKKVVLEKLILNTGRQRNVLVFYPTDFGSICLSELQKLNSLYKSFLAINTEVLIISRDSVHIHKKWLETESTLIDFQIKLVSDREGKLLQELGVIHMNTGEYERVSIIVSPIGQIAYIEVTPAIIGRNMAELLRKTQALNHLIKNPEIMCLEGWSPDHPVTLETQMPTHSQFMHE